MRPDEFVDKTVAPWDSAEAASFHLQYTQAIVWASAVIARVRLFFVVCLMKIYRFQYFETIFAKPVCLARGLLAFLEEESSEHSKQS